MKVWLILSLLMSCLSLSCRSHADADSDLQGRPNSGGHLKLEKTYDLTVARDPRLMKGRDIKFLSHAFRDYSFSQFLVDELTTAATPLACELLDLVPGDAKSLITNVVEVSGETPSFHVFAADISCEAPL